MDDSYAGKTDRELLVEIYTTVKDNCGILEDHECRVREIEDEVKTARGSVKAVGGFSFLVGLYVSLKSLFGI